MCICVCRYSGIHQSGCGTGQHQRGGQWSLPRHEQQGRTVRIGEYTQNTHTHLYIDLHFNMYSILYTTSQPTWCVSTASRWHILHY